MNQALDLPYGADPAQKVDLFWPVSGTAPFPLVLIVHGGGWHSGDKSDDKWRTAALRLAGLGYAAAVPNYRLATETSNQFPAAIQDVRCALRYLDDNAARYQIDASRIVATGGSAGGHLVSLLGTTNDTAKPDDSCTVSGVPRISGVVSFYGPQDLRSSATWPPDTRVAIRTFLGAPPEEVPAKAALASPLTHVTSADPPFLLTHGTVDSSVAIDQSRNMAAALRAAAVPVTLVELPGIGHGYDLLGEDPRIQPSMCTFLEFLRVTLRR